MVTLSHGLSSSGSAGYTARTFQTSPLRLPWFIVASMLPCLVIYGVAELLALRTWWQEAYGPLIPANVVTPYFLSGALYPSPSFPAGLEQAAYILPWAHAVALMRYGLIEGSPSGLSRDPASAGPGPARASGRHPVHPPQVEVEQLLAALVRCPPAASRLVHDAERPGP